MIMSIVGFTVLLIRLLLQARAKAYLSMYGALLHQYDLMCLKCKHKYRQ
jgi:hypothetical protein